MNIQTPENFTTPSRGVERQFYMRKIGLLSTLMNIAKHSSEPPTTDDESQVSLIIEALRAEQNPFIQLGQAVLLYSELPESTISDTMDPLIDSLSHNTLEVLQLEEASATNSNPSRGCALGIAEVKTCIDAWDLRRNDETLDLAEYAATHTGHRDSSKTLVAALKIAKNEEISFNEALEKVNRSAFEDMVPSHQFEYPWLYDSSIAPPEKSYVA